MLRANIYKSSLLSLLACAVLQPVGAVAPPSAVDDGLRKETQAARQAYSEHDYEAAASHYQEALKLGAKLPPRLRIALLSNLGAALRESHKFPEAAEALKKAIGIAEQAHIERDAAATTAMKQYAVLLRRMGKNMDADVMEARAAGVTASSSVSTSPGFLAALNAAADQDEDQQESAAPTTAVNSPSGPRRIADIPLDELKRIVDEHPNDFEIARYLAHKYYELKQWQNALSAYQTLKERFPNQAKQIHISLAQCYVKCDRMSAAIDELKTAINESPDNRAAYMNLIACYENSGDLHSSVELSKSFVEKFPDDPNVPLLNERVENFEHDLKSSSSVSSTKPSEYEKRIAWPQSFFPLKVYMYPFENLKMAPSASGMTARSAYEIVANACDAWTQGTHGKVSFVTVGTPEEASIVVQFETDRTDMEGEQSLGITKRKIGDKVRVFLLATGADGGDIVPEDLYHTCLHEFGHALALEHSSDPHDIMYPSHMPNVVDLSDHDCARVITLYSR